MLEISIRNEKPEDYREVEIITREAFWNNHAPGCDEHYLVHKMRNHHDFIPQLAYVAIVNNKIVGNIMYTKSYIQRKNNEIYNTVSFGPISVLPEYQRQGIGSALIEYSGKEVQKLDIKAIIIFGSPCDYCKHGFASSRDYNITDSSGNFPLGLLVLELVKGALSGIEGKFFESDVYNIDEKESEEFNKSFYPKKKEHKYSQDIFNILVRAYIK